MELRANFLIGIFSFVIFYAVVEAVPHYRGYSSYYGYKPGDSKTPKLNSYLKKVLDPIKESMRNGMPQFGLPVLDPFKAGNFSKSVTNDKMNASIFIQDLIVSGLSNFTLYNLDGHLGNLTVLTKVVFHKILVTSDRYKLLGEVAKIVPLIGDGKMSIQANEVEVTTSITFSFPSAGNLRIEAVELDLDFRNISFYFENILGGGSIGDLINAYLSATAKRLYNAVKPKLLSQAKEMLLREGNKKLSKVKLEKLFPN